MSDENSNQGPTQQVNLQQIAQQFMTGLQRHFDMLAFNLAAREAVTEEAYNKRVGAPGIMPAAPRHQNFEQTQAYARDLLVRQVINDSLNLASNAMNNSHFFLALVKLTQGRRRATSEEQEKARSEQKAFIPLQLDGKFDRLEKDYGIMCELEDTVVSLGFALQALVRHGGIVKADHVDDNGELAIDLKTVAGGGEAGTDAARPPEKIIDHRKVFREGESIVFSDVELQLVIVTIASFADSLFKSVAAYARSHSDGEDG